MKPLCMVHFTLALLAGGQLSAQNFAVDWFKIAGGGGQSTGGVYAVTGTIGQPDAGSMSGGPFSLVGGFWGVVATVQTPGAPLLSILNTVTNAVLLSWPSPSPGFRLQQNSDLSTTNWTTLSITSYDDGTNKTFLLLPAAGNRFFRLKWP